MKRLTSIFVSAVLLLQFISFVKSDFYVNCNTGNDANDGSSGSPFLTPNKARNMIRALQPLTSSVTVYFQTSDCYPRDPSSNINYTYPVLTLEPQDSGVSTDITITYTALPGATVRFISGASIPANAWTPTSTNPNIYQANLESLGLSSYGYGQLTPGGLGTCADDQAELFFNSNPMTLARYPNILSNGSWAWINIDKVINSSTFTVADPDGRISKWAQDPLAAAHGYWSFDWADSYVNIQYSTASDANTATLTSYASSPPVYGYIATARFMGVNILSELDAPNEYYIDKTNNILYFYPPSSIQTGEAFLSMGEYTILATTSNSISDNQPLSYEEQTYAARHMKTPIDLLNEPVNHLPQAGDGSTVAYLTIQGITIAYARNTAMVFPSSNSITLNNNIIFNTGHNGFSFAGTNSTLTNNLVANTGCAASSVYGGDENHLISANNYVGNNEFHNYARFTRTYNPGVGWGGVGNTYENNYIHNAPHNGMLGGGNNCLFSNNTFDTLVYESTDSGAWYAGRSWVRRGNTLIGNTFRNIQNTEKMTLGAPSVQAIYLDDQLSGTNIISNTFINCLKGSFVGGGRDVIITNNTYINCGYAVHIDNRGMNWQLDDCTYNSTYTGPLVQDLFAINYTLPPYSTNYPPIVNTLNYHPCVPVNITVNNNRYCNLTQGFIDVSVNDTIQWYDNVNNNNPFSC